MTSQAASGSDARKNGSEARKTCTVVIKNSHGRYTGCISHGTVTQRACMHAEFADPSVSMRSGCDAMRSDKSTEDHKTGSQECQERVPRWHLCCIGSSQLGPRSWYLRSSTTVVLLLLAVRFCKYTCIDLHSAAYQSSLRSRCHLPSSG